MVELARKVKDAQQDGLACGTVLAEAGVPAGGKPLSFAQQRLWFVDQLRPGSAAYHMPAALRLDGPLDASVVERSLREVVHQHEVLRTVFRMVGGQLVQIVLPDVPFSLPVVDLSSLSQGDREAETARRAVVEFRQPFDLERGPLMRARLLRLGAEKHVLLLSIHHITCDGWSMGVLFQDFAALYAAFLRGEPSPLPPLPVRYADYAVSQRTRMQGETLREQLAYWKQQLDGLAETLELPTDRPRPAEPALRGAQRLFSLPSQLTESLQALGQREGTTLFMTLLAAFQALLCRYTGQHDIAVGTPAADRPRRNLHKMIGCFLNLVVLRTDLSGDPSFRELLRRVRNMALGAYAHQELPFERLVEEMRPVRDPGRTPLFQVMFTLQNEPTKGMSLPDLKITPLAVDCGAAQYDLRLTMTRTETGLDGALEYDSELFDPATIERMTGHFEILLAAAVADPDRRLSDLPLLTGAERHQLLVSWNDTGREYPRERCLHELFQEQAARTPEAVAVAHGGVALTYVELNRRANRLAHRLRALGVRSESLVGLCVERTTDMVVGLLGILKAGGAYVPIDPDFPQARLRLILDDARVPVLVTSPALRDRLPAAPAEIVVAVRDEDESAVCGDGDLDGAAAAENLAYVIYTSGSTGKPKGVQVTHRALTNFLFAMRTLFPMTERDILLAVTTLSFDIAGLEIYLPLLQGARVELVGRDDAFDGAMLARRLADSGATFLQATPATWRLLLDTGWRGTPDLTMLCGGEALPRDLANRLLGKGAALWNLYGPTETTIWSTAARVAAGDGPVTIGRPIANTQLYVLDGDLQPVPVGVVGELYIGGDGLARGYLGQLDLTAERFVPDSYSGRPGARLYRTGDRVRYQPDGNMEFLGRADHQVKIRGFRIEPGEIEAALRGHAAVRQAVVVAMDDPAGGKSLAAYVVAHSGQQPTPRDLRSFLRERLPTYMVPSAFVLLDSLPLTFSGKVDRRLLPDARQVAPVAEEEGADRLGTPTEHAIAEVYRDVLGAQALSHDTFIDLGGDSLQVIEVIARLEGRLGVRLAPREILLQTVGQLALTCEENLAVFRPSRFSVIRAMFWALWRRVVTAVTGGHSPTSSLPQEHRS